MKRVYKIGMLFLIFISFFFIGIGCTTNEERRIKEEKNQVLEKKPVIPKQLQGDRSVVVYVVDEGVKREIDIEEYVAGVLGGEINNDWPDEAIKAQAILARTFVMEFLTDKTSKYQNADVSTDIEEAQAWAPKDVNNKVRKAVQETEGMVVAYDGHYIKAWFHSHAGGKTATAKEGLAFKDLEPPYIQSVESPDSQEAPPEDANWTAEFTKKEIINAANKVGSQIDSCNDISIGKKGPSGRAVTLFIDGTEVSAPNFRVALGSTKMKSTLLTDFQVLGDKLIMKGKGYGHGVGMSQWGAYAMAKEGKTAEEIIKYYFKNVDIMKLW
ncbi:SpoIID/LytB domain-containing protein [Garciella nitratireducens]|uniref:Stage II sporulation protein D n=1 Tax=Garciella nitratireducens DSM 15102 TaxID=1121911 RepID=A0A1T4L507_9FIRM|nr:SpoIID/LytB domain-containing protein [Garciella nitratireducens]RBP35474.1 stage II sporulation protein D [Garciella nitratireducens]SJZ49806.1 stage II sporulation protein D [Garciella nitratireducens DSM 15102]